MEIGVKPDAVKFPEISKGLAFFNPPAGKIVDLRRLSALLRESGYKLRLIRLTLDGEVTEDRSQVRIPRSGQLFGLEGLKPGIKNSVRIVAVWNADQALAQKKMEGLKEVLDVESSKELP